MVFCVYMSGLKINMSQHSLHTYRFAWLMSPFPLRMGTTDVDAVLKETTSPSFAKGELLNGSLL